MPLSWGRIPKHVGRWPWGLIGAFALMLAAESFIARHDLDFRNLWAWDWATTGRAARRETPGCAVLCFGDSLGKYGVVPQAIEARLGKRAHNLALNAGPPAVNYYLLRRALDAGAKPEAVVVDFVPHGLVWGPESNMALWPHLLDARECLDLARTLRSAGVFGQLMLARNLPSLRGRIEVRGNVLAALGGTTVADRFLTPVLLRNMRANRGAYLASPNPHFRGETQASARLAEALYPTWWRCDPKNVAYVERFLALAESRGIPVFWLILPFSSEVHALRTSMGLDEQYTQFARSIQAHHPTLTVIDARRSGYGAQVHVDPMHLDCRGALALSQGLADVMADALGGRAQARWVDLPTYRDPSAADAQALALEDTDQSKHAIERNQRRR